MAEKNKRKANGKNSPVIGMNGYLTEPGDNTKFIQVGLEVFNLPKIELDDPQTVANRLAEYFDIYAKYDLKPTVSGMAMALGMNRQTLSAIAHDKPIGGRGNYTSLPTDVTDLIKKAYDYMENLWENYMQQGKLNPVTGIFLAKNNFAYKDQTETVLTPNIQKDQYTTESIRERYLLEAPDDSGSNE
jgi:hypothetical protein